MAVWRGLPLLIGAVSLFAHPMGNFSVSHYARLQPSSQGIELRYVLDLAEIPTLEMLRAWNLGRNSPQVELDSQAGEQGREWINNLAITVNGKAVRTNFKSARLVIADGAGGLPIARITTEARISATHGALTYEDRNYPDRAGWKEIIIEGGDGVTVKRASQSNADLSRALTRYPADPTTAPPRIFGPNWSGLSLLSRYPRQ